MSRYDEMTDQEKAELMAAYYAKRPDIKELDNKRHVLDVRFSTVLELTALDKADWQVRGKEFARNLKAVNDEREKLWKRRQEQAELEYLGRWPSPGK
jgi:hypothetical protein